MSGHTGSEPPTPPSRPLCGPGRASPGALRIRVVPGGQLSTAIDLATELGLPLVEAVTTPADRSPSGVWLEVGSEGLSLRLAGTDAPGPVRAELVGGALGWRRRQGPGRRMPIARAVGLGSPGTPRLLDATAGLLRDAVVLAGLGARVTACERHPVVGALVRDALARARGADADFAAWLDERLEFRGVDARELLGSTDAGWDVVYLDPMYPGRTGSALNRKEMRVLGAALAASAGTLDRPDADAPELLCLARASGARRVVVKRPAGSPPLGDAPPDLVFEGRSTRFDVYLRASSRPTAPARAPEAAGDGGPGPGR